MKKAAYIIALVVSVLLLAFSVFNWAACYHDILIMRGKCDRMSASLCEMRQELEAQDAEVRQIKTDGEIILRIVASGEFEGARGE